MTKEELLIQMEINFYDNYNEHEHNCSKEHIFGLLDFKKEILRYQWEYNGCLESYEVYLLSNNCEEYLFYFFQDLFDCEDYLEEYNFDMLKTDHKLKYYEMFIENGLYEEWLENWYIKYKINLRETRINEILND